MISYDDAYEPTKTMEATRKLVEEDQVLFTLATIGTNYTISPTMLFDASDSTPENRNQGSMPANTRIG